MNPYREITRLENSIKRLEERVESQRRLLTRRFCELQQLRKELLNLQSFDRRLGP